VNYIRHFQQTSRRIVDVAIKNKEYDRIVCSPYLWCRQTASHFKARKVVIDPLLCEYQDHKHLRSFKLDSTTAQYDVPGSDETWEECARRIDKHIKKIMKMEGTTLVVTHGIVVRYAEQKLLGSSQYKRGKDIPFGDGFSVIIDN
jgi:broad specificity phosphatase PhoE